MFNILKWIDHVVDPPNRFKHTRVDDQTFDVERAGQVMQEGTDQSAANFNRMELGILDAQIFGSLLFSQVHRMDVSATPEVHTLSMKNTASYPFNNSEQTVDLKITRSSMDYDVQAEVEGNNGKIVGVRVYDKKVNGFKVKYDGSAPSATVKLRITGGI